jgi:hypothetical protein
MFDEKPEFETREGSDEDSGISEDTPQGGGKGEISGQGGEARAGAATPPIGEQENPGQTAHDAPDDDVGTPEDEPERTE